VSAPALEQGLFQYEHDAQASESAAMLTIATNASSWFQRDAIRR